MRYHNITTDDMNNGDGLRVVLWLAGCDHHCQNCQNQITWNPDGGIPFTHKEVDELFAELSKDYISGLTLSGGDPLYTASREDVLTLVKDVRRLFPDKTIWLYTGYVWEEIKMSEDARCIVECVDVLVDGEYKESLRDVTRPWVGSTNQRVIDVRRTLQEGRVVLYESN